MYPGNDTPESGQKWSNQWTLHPHWGDPSKTPQWVRPLDGEHVSIPRAFNSRVRLLRSQTFVFSSKNLIRVSFETDFYSTRS